MSPIALLTDFGTQDGYVGILKGVITTLAPQVSIVDISHNIPPQNLWAARFCLANALPYFPDGTIAVSVVDPGVGGDRRAVAIQTERGWLVGPDNGVWDAVLQRDRPVAAVALTNPTYWREAIPSYTFHGRDIFASVAAHLARGVAIADLGEAINPADLHTLPLPPVQLTWSHGITQTLTAPTTAIDPTTDPTTDLIKDPTTDPTTNPTTDPTTDPAMLSPELEHPHPANTREDSGPEDSGPEDSGPENHPNPDASKTPIQLYSVTATVQHCDHFGNLITTVPGAALRSLPDRCVLTWMTPAPSLAIPWVKTYGEVAPGAIAALIGSHGWLELAVRGGSAAATLELTWGDTITLAWLEAGTGWERAEGRSPG